MSVKISSPMSFKKEDWDIVTFIKGDMRRFNGGLFSQIEDFERFSLKTSSAFASNLPKTKQGQPNT